jgi:SAM-dependent methyltransferase
MATFHSRDSASSAFWNERFEQRFTPWDQGGVPAALQTFVLHTPHPLTTLIPGCGNAYEVAYLAETGWDVTAIDFSSAAVASAKRLLGRWATRVEQADFFTYSPPRTPQFIYERAFLCALPKPTWPKVVQRWASFLQKGGLLGGFFFYDDNPHGPPFGATKDELLGLLSPFFEQIDDQGVTDSMPVFAGKERWQLWRRI